ncbi:PREDICTED: uncharacterized protein LOC106808788, partial [Priapulus caudatus]|uniref:Uncharacterized protein LOC106808788 n=1 Tax=Priapulus caudatus TaxID=37621 RepID=A0ABM1E4K4_PRICU
PIPSHPIPSHGMPSSSPSDHPSATYRLTHHSPHTSATSNHHNTSTAHQRHYHASPTSQHSMESLESLLLSVVTAQGIQ